MPQSSSLDSGKVRGGPLAGEAPPYNICHWRSDVGAIDASPFSSERRERPARDDFKSVESVLTLHSLTSPSAGVAPSVGRRRACPKHILIAFWLRHTDCSMNRASARSGCLPYRFIAFGVTRSPLLHGHECADWNFGEEFARSIFRQPDAAVRCRIVRHITSVHSKIETAQAHEIWHLDVVNRGTMVAFLVGDHKLAPLSRVTRPTGRASRVIYRFAVPDESDALHRQRNFDPQLIRRRAAAEKNLRGTPVAGLRGNIQCRHFVPGR